MAQRFPIYSPCKKPGKRWSFAYYSNEPNRAESAKGFGGYLGRDEQAGAFLPGLRYRWADEVCSRIGHTGWYTDSFGDGDKIRGLVARLPHERGFLIGWSMGGGMCASFERAIYADEQEAARAADQMAEHAAERERDYQAEQDRIQDQEEREGERA